MNKYTQRLYRESMKFGFVRDSLIGLYNKFKTNPSLETVGTKTNFKLLDVNKAIHELNHNALTNTFKINDDILQKVIEDCKDNLVYPNLKYDGTPIKEGKGQHIEYNNPKPFQNDCIWFAYKNISSWDSIKEITYDPKLIEIARSYLGNNPIVRNEYLWWSFPAKGSGNEDFDSPRYWFHYDIDDFKFLKIFIYLNDVDLDTGPHIVVKNTHKNKPLKYKLNRVVKSENLTGFFKDKEVVTLTGEKGTCFMEDTFTYHNGTPPVKPRLVLQIEYALTNLKLG